MPDYHWCPGQFWDPGWGNNWYWGRCHDDFYGDGDPHDRDHWHVAGDWHPDGGWGPGGPHGPGWHDDHGGPGGPGWNGHQGW